MKRSKIFHTLLVAFGAAFFFLGCPTHNLLRETPVMWDVNLVEREKADWDEFKTHLLPEGLVVYLKRPPGDVAALYKQGIGQADGAYFTGVALTMLVMKWKVTGDPEVLAMAKKTWDAMHMLVTGSGYPGLVARSFGKNDPTDPGYVFRRDGSGDGLIGWLYGASTFSKYVDDPVRLSQVAMDVKAICAHLRKHDFKIYEGPNTPTKYGDFKTPVMGIPIGHYAIAMMGLGTLAVRLNPSDETCIGFLDWIMDKDYHRQCQHFYSWFPHHADNSMAFALNFFTVWSNDQSTHRREFYKSGIESFWDRTYDWQMALYALIYRFGGGDDHSSHVQDSIDRLRNLTPQYSRIINENQYVKEHTKIVPLEDRKLSAFLWTRNVIDELTKKTGPFDPNSYTRLDFLVAYWFGRFIGEYKIDNKK